MEGGTILSEAASESKELLASVYKDLASPGVRQVGKALETVIEMGALALLPVRLANEYARHWEKKSFQK